MMEILDSTLGITKINAKSLLEFFEPLKAWLTSQNEEAEEYIGWKIESPFKSALKRNRRKRSVDYRQQGFVNNG